MSLTPARPQLPGQSSAIVVSGSKGALHRVKIARRNTHWRGEGLPAVDLPHSDLTRREQRPEQHSGGLGAGQHGLAVADAASVAPETDGPARSGRGLKLDVR